MASTGDNGGITLSEIAYKESRRWIKYYSKKKKYAKGLGDIFTYQVFAEKPLNYQIPEVQLKFINAFKKVKETDDFKTQLKVAKNNKKSFLKQLKQRYQLEIQKEEEEKKQMLSSRGPQSKKIQIQVQ